MTLEETVKFIKVRKSIFKTVREKKTLAVKIEFGRNNKVMIRVPYDQELMKKIITVHSSRHSFATHLLEGGNNLRYSQDILWHKESIGTEIYSHVITKNLLAIKKNT